MGYRFIPNDFARQTFNLAAEYSGAGMTDLLENALGKANYDRYMVAQDPLCGGKSQGKIDIITNPGERDPNRMRFACIGIIRKT